MSVWFTADTHFGHTNIAKYCNRPFLSREEQQRLASDPRGRWQISTATLQRHDQALIESINQRVQPEDTLWILGDFCWGKHSQAEHYRQQIRCQTVNLVWGNHDHRSIQPLFSQTLEQGMIRVKGQRIWLNHYPMRSWDGRFHGTWHLYGHVHDRLSDQDRATPEMLTKDVGVDANDYSPVSYDQLREYMRPRVEAFQKAKTEGQTID